MGRERVCMLWFQSGEAFLLFVMSHWVQLGRWEWDISAALCRDASVTWGSWKHRTCVNKAFYLPSNTGQERGCISNVWKLASLSNSLPNLGSFPQHCDVLFGLLSGTYSAYFKNMYNFLAIQTCICMQLIELASVFWQWCCCSLTYRMSFHET